MAASALLATGAAVGGGTVHFVPSATAQVSAVDGIPSTANLHIHKYLGAPTDIPSDGTEQTLPDGYEPAEGVTFYIYQVPGIDLTTLEGWQAASEVDIDSFFTGEGSNTYNTLNPDVLAGLGEGTATGADGTAAFDGIDAGLYLVVEEPYPTAGGQTLAPAAPFLVTVPMTDPGPSEDNPEGRGSWLETVNVYPKNQAITAPVKTIFDPETGEETDGVDLTGSAVGEQIGYEITAAVPAPGQDDFTGFVIADRLPTEIINPVLDTFTIGGEDVPTGDYAVNTYAVEGGSVFRVELAGATLAALNEEGSEGDPIVVRFTAEVGETPTTTLDNQAWVLPAAAPAPDWDPAVLAAGAVSNTVRSAYGEITINKTGEDADGAAIQPNGAVFELHRCTEDGALVGDSDPIRVGGQTEWATGEDGVDGSVTISGIHLSNVDVSMEGTAGGYEDLWADNGSEFCLVETQAPEGHALLPEPFPVDLVYAEGTTALVTATADIENVRANAGFRLPLTGGVGIWLILGAGALLLIIAAVYYAATRNRGRD